MKNDNDRDNNNNNKLIKIEPILKKITMIKIQ